MYRIAVIRKTTIFAPISEHTNQKTILSKKEDPIAE